MELLAVDQSQAMIDAVWPGDTERRRARVGDWFALSLADGSVAIALGDGCFSLLDFPRGYLRFAASVARVLAPGGLFSIRLFCRPPAPESPDAVFAALEARRIGNFHAFKWRLAMALQGDDITRGVPVESVWSAFQARLGDASPAAGRLGWAVEEVQTIDNYRGSASVYTFPTVAEVRRALDCFELVEEWRGEYELGERCPTLLFRRR
jgi:SAM-dependent methyltransferase